MRKRFHTIATAAVAGALLGAIVNGGAGAQTANADPWHTPMLDPPAVTGDPPPLDPAAQPDQGVAIDDLLAQVRWLVGSLDSACAPPDRPDTGRIAPSDVVEPCNVLIARNVGAPDSVAVASQTQDAPVTQSAEAG